ncbi:ATP-binding protein [Ligilactobacillus salivarius]|uniref:ATP-binding protein n=1 Tax=Ligilactobacillus salivarius TaxID=1624 RepID=UPI0025A48FE5|nr:ATP-binding protein [Ligilactobacillus salivarius]MDM8272893.1 ATP-binding protein [Ligilactobacillus salivarius]
MINDELLTLINRHDESEILDYKENMKDKKQIGEYISALGNSALMLHLSAAYLIWGVKDISKEIVGTNIKPYLEKAPKGNMPFTTYLEQYLDPKINLYWEEHIIEEKRILLLKIDVTHVNRPIKFLGQGFIRVGTSKKSLAEYPEKERLIWKSFESTFFESQIAKNDVTANDIFELLDLKLFSDLMDISYFDTELVIKSLLDKHLIVDSGNNYNITNLGAYTFAKNMDNFPTLHKRTIRITKYNGNNKIDNAIFDEQGKLGIIISFNNIIKNITRLIPYKEEYSAGSRKDILEFPQIAIRELVANALVHQDFTITGMYPSVEIFDNRIVITNPGIPLIEADRFLDFPPISRNKDLSELMQLFNIVEARGTGIDKVVEALERNELPALDIKVQGISTSITLRKKKKFTDMTVTERNQSIYWNACLKYVEDEQISNKSLRDRFKLSSRDSSLISKAISNAIQANLIKPYDSNLGKKFMKYIPYWGVDVFNR